MHKTIRIILAAVVVGCLALAPLLAASVDTDGAHMGQWTQDYDAALKLAKDKNLPIMLKFTGSDWCYWCKLMDKNVFAYDKFYDYAKNNLVLVTIDFPRDKSIVPEKFQARNKELGSKYGIRGVPTFVILSPDGQKELGRLQAGKDKTVDSFIDEIKGVLK